MASPVDALGSLTSLASDASQALGQLESGLGDPLGGLLDASTRLYRLEGDGALAGLQVEAFVIEEALSQPWRLELVTLHEDATLDLDAMLAQPATLVTVLADGTEHRRSGLVLQASAEDSDGGFTRYRLVLQPWLGFLAQTLRSRVWQERNVTDIVEAVLGDYAAYGSWRWSPCVGQLLADATEGGVRSYCVQYRESDLDFVSRLLAVVSCSSCTPSRWKRMPAPPAALAEAAFSGQLSAPTRCGWRPTTARKATPSPTPDRPSVHCA